MFMLDRTIAPPFARSTSFNLIKPEEVVLSNGVPIYFVPGGSQDVLKIECVMPAGRWYEEKAGAAWFAAQLLSRGTRKRDSFEIARVFDQFGAHLDINPAFDYSSVAVLTLNSSLEPVLDLFLELLTEPVFPDREFSQMRDVYLQNLSVNNEKTSYVASKVFRQNLFGDKHPYGRAVEENDVTALTTDDLLHHFSGYMHSPRIFVSGKVTATNREMLSKQFSSLPSGHPPAAREFALSEPTAKIHLPKEGSVQSSVRFGKRSVLRKDTDYAHVLFATHILGGYFGSRLMKNIREEKGLTYGISASLVTLLRDSYIIIGADVNKENVGLTFDEIRKELRLLREVPVSTEELETSRNHFIGSLQAEITTPFAHADKIKTMNLFGLDDSFYQRLIDQVEHMNAEQIMAIANKYLHEDSFTQVAVG